MTFSSRPPALGTVDTASQTPGGSSGIASDSKIQGTTIIPHFDQIPAWFMRVFRVVNFNRATMVGIDGYTALVLDNGTSIVRGQGGVVIWGKKGKRRFGNGPVLG